MPELQAHTDVLGIGQAEYDPRAEFVYGEPFVEYGKDVAGAVEGEAGEGIGSLGYQFVARVPVYLSGETGVDVVVEAVPEGHVAEQGHEEGVGYLVRLDDRGAKGVDLILKVAGPACVTVREVADPAEELRAVLVTQGSQDFRAGYVGAPEGAVRKAYETGEAQAGVDTEFGGAGLRSGLPLEVAGESQGEPFSAVEYVLVEETYGGRHAEEGGGGGGCFQVELEAL